MQYSPSSEPNRFAASQENPWEFMEPEGSLPHSQELAKFPYPELDNAVHAPSLLPKDSF